MSGRAGSDCPECDGQLESDDGMEYECRDCGRVFDSADSFSSERRPSLEGALEPTSGQRSVPGFRPLRRLSKPFLMPSAFGSVQAALAQTGRALD